MNNAPSKRTYRLPILALAAVLGLVVLAATGKLAARSKAQDSPTVRGIVVSTHTSGHEWGLDVMGPTLDDLREVGADWVATHPYAGIRRDGSVRYQDFDPENPPEWLVRPIREAKARGMRVLIKPHLAYWGSGFKWRGEIEFESASQWDRFFNAYEEWIVKIARACREADGLVIATELDRTLHFEKRWRGIIENVRKQTGAKLTYGANWADYERVTFWDALDIIGVHAYFPLTDSEERPTRKQLEAAWSKRMGMLRTFAKKHDRQIVFTELGYNRSFDAARQPWAYPTDGEEAEPFQAECLEVALEAVENEPVVVGSFLWKWFPRPRPVGRNFQLATPRMMEAIRSVWQPGEGAEQAR